MTEFENEINSFKLLEKKVKEYKHISDVSNIIIDLSNNNNNNNNENRTSTSIINKICSIELFQENKEVYSFNGYDGLFVIRNSLPLWLQIEMAYLALNECPQPPNTTSLGTNQEGANVWNNNKDILNELDTNNSHSLCEKTLELRSSTLGHLRWSALGFQYDWTAKKYPQTFDGQDDPNYRPALEQVFPRNLSSVVKEIVHALSLQSENHPDLNMTIEPEASIVNYCMPGSFMGGHVDDAELTHDHPVVSISLGRPCAFLVGGLTKNDPPIAILLRSGDTVILSGRSRLCYHGVTRIYDCPYNSNYRKESNKKRIRCTNKCREVCCENPNITQENNQQEYTLPNNFDDFLFSNRDLNENIHTSLEGFNCHQINLNENNENQKINTINNENETENEGGICLKCSKSIISKDEERKVLNYLRLSRININVRQVYPTLTGQTSCNLKEQKGDEGSEK